MAVITKPIVVPGTLNTVLGVGPRADGYYYVEDLCTSPKINWRSKMKPVACPYVEPDRKNKVSAYGKTNWWWKGRPTYTEIPAGLTIGNYTTIDKAAWLSSAGVKYLGFRSKLDVLRAFNPITNQYHTGDNSPIKDNYIYVPPRGGINGEGYNEPSRLLDFDNYWPEANYNIIPDVGTETTGTLVNLNNPAANPVKCGIMSAAVQDKDAASELSFDDIFGGIGSASGFTVVTGVLNGSTFDIIGLSIDGKRDDQYFKEVAIDLAPAEGRTVIAIYCAAITVAIGGDTYYVPILQSNSMDRPNTPIPAYPKRRVYNYWAVGRIPYFTMTMDQKQNYGTDYPFSSVRTMTSFQTQGLMNRWYLKLGMPQKSSTYSLSNTSFKIEFTGMFRNSYGQLNLSYYTLTSEDTRFVLKNNEVSAYDWGATETVLVAPGSGKQTCYLAIYNVFANRGGVQTIYGGTIWRIRVFVMSSGQFPSTPDIEFGSLDDATRLNINVQAI